MSAPTVDNPRAFTVTDTDHSGIALVVSTLLMTWAILCFLIRIYTRLASSSSPKEADDLLCAVATIFGVIQTIIAAVSIQNGFGRAGSLLSDSQIVAIEKDQFAVDLLCLVTLALTKCCMVCFHLRITPRKDQRIVALGLLGVVIVFGIASVVIAALRCHPQSPWDNLVGSCTNYTTGWVAIASMDVATELALMAVPLWILFDLQMPFRRKCIIAGAFALRLPVIIAAAVHVYYIDRWTTSTTPLVDAVTPFLCLQVEVHYASMAMTFPTVGSFMKSLNTRWGALDAAEASAYALDSLSGARSRKTPKGSRNSQLGTSRSATGLRPDTHGYSFRVRTEQEAPRRSTSSDNSERMIIRKTVSATVVHNAA